MKLTDEQTKALENKQESIVPVLPVIPFPNQDTKKI